MKRKESLSTAAQRELRRRATHQLPLRSLEVDYYRIRQRLFFPLPLRDLPGGLAKDGESRLSTICGFSTYPYATWLLWSLEERILALGWTAETSPYPEAENAAASDLEALAGWTRFHQMRSPDLCSSHCCRILVQGLQWRWPGIPLKRQLRAALRRLVDEGAAQLEPLPAQTARGLLSKGFRFPNIPTIGSLSLSSAAFACRHPLAVNLSKRAHLMAGLWLERGLEGQVEGVCYDGYTADFLMDWLVVCPSPIRRGILAHPRLKQILEEIRFLGAPRCPENLAPIGDVEPDRMRFHYSFAAKYLRFCKNVEKFPFPTKATEFVRSDALPRLPTHCVAHRRAARKGSLQDAHYALILNGGVGSSDVRVAASWSNSLFGHIQGDCGSIVIGAGSKWILNDPGYQQYMPTSERDFTLGPAAHNQPVINGAASSLRPKSRCFEVLHAQGTTGLRLNLGQTYEGWKGCFHRAVFRGNNGLVVVEDSFEGEPIRKLDYHWHGCPEGSWHVADGWAAILAGAYALLFTCCDQPLKPTDLQRLRGSRGQLSIVKSLRYAKPRKNLTVRWVFEIVSAAVPFPPRPKAFETRGAAQSPPAGDWTPINPSKTHPSKI
jgi:hypothetical protein